MSGRLSQCDRNFGVILHHELVGKNVALSIVLRAVFIPTLLVTNSEGFYGGTGHKGGAESLRWDRPMKFSFKIEKSVILRIRGRDQRKWKECLYRFPAVPFSLSGE